MKVIEKKGEDQTELMVANLNCATAKIAALESELAIYKSASGLVAAFNRASADPCPDGWIPFDAANGRFVVGAGLSKNLDENGAKLSPHLSYLEKPDEATGGEERHTLTEPQMPSHSHLVYPHAGYGWPDIPFDKKIRENTGANGDDTTTYVHVGVTSAKGGDQSHNNMPPFVALYYCIKK